MKRTKLKANLDDELSLNRSSVYQEFLAEREEILKHKWLESEKAGHDIGYERAVAGGHMVPFAGTNAATTIDGIEIVFHAPHIS